MPVDREELSKLRKAQALTKRELAQRAGLSASYLTELESGTKPGGPKAVRALAAALEVDLDRLLVVAS